MKTKNPKLPTQRNMPKPLMFDLPPELSTSSVWRRHSIKSSVEKKTKTLRNQNRNQKIRTQKNKTVLAKFDLFFRAVGTVRWKIQVTRLWEPISSMDKSAASTPAFCKVASGRTSQKPFNKHLGALKISRLFTKNCTAKRFGLPELQDTEALLAVHYKEKLRKEASSICTVFQQLTNFWNLQFFRLSKLSSVTTLSAPLGSSSSPRRTNLIDQSDQKSRSTPKDV